MTASGWGGLHQRPQGDQLSQWEKLSGTHRNISSGAGLRDAEGAHQGAGRNKNCSFLRHCGSQMHIRAQAHGIMFHRWSSQKQKRPRVQLHLLVTRHISLRGKTWEHPHGLWDLCVLFHSYSSDQVLKNHAIPTSGPDNHLGGMWTLCAQEHIMCSQGPYLLHSRDSHS